MPSSGGFRGSGGAPGSGGAAASGGLDGAGGAQQTSGGASSAGAMSAGGVQGSGGSPDQCNPGALECDAHRRCSPNGAWVTYQCGPLMATGLTDVEGIDASGLSQFGATQNAAFFRCKSLTVCGILQSCIYYSGYLGSVQSAEDHYTDGDELTVPQAVKIKVDGGAASQCSTMDATFVDTDSLILRLGDDKQVRVTFPAFAGAELVLYVREDGATFFDVALTQRAG